LNVTRGLVISEPWIGYILSGEKTWEMRSVATSIRGWFGLIRKGSGTVMGVAELIDCGEPLAQIELLATLHLHGIPASYIHSGEIGKWNVPWKLGRVKSFGRPVPYRHKKGAVKWVIFDPEVTQAITRECGSLPSPAAPTAPAVENIAVPIEHRPPRAVTAKASANQAPSPPSGAGPVIGRAPVSKGGLENGYFKLTSFLGAFPADAVGGANEKDRAPREVTVDRGGPTLAHTDIDGEKKFFRTRGWVKLFFARTGADAGDDVEVEETGPFAYRVRLAKGASGRP
jgi:hypothetical protein